MLVGAHPSIWWGLVELLGKGRRAFCLATFGFAFTKALKDSLGPDINAETVCSYVEG